MEKAERFNSSEAEDPMKAKFLQGTLQEEGEFIVDFQDEVIGKYLQVRTNNIRHLRGFKVEPSGEGYRLNLRFVKYLRFLDIQGKEGIPKTKLILYNRVVFGRLASTANKLQFGYTKEIKQMMERYYDKLQIKI